MIDRSEQQAALNAANALEGVPQYEYLSAFAFCAANAIRTNGIGAVAAYCAKKGGVYSIIHALCGDIDNYTPNDTLRILHQLRLIENVHANEHSRTVKFFPFK